MIEEAIDNRGTPIKTGDKVAYNLSGQIACGKVISVSPAIRNDRGYGYKQRAMIKVQMEFPKYPAGAISKVRDPKNVMVIFEDSASSNLNGSRET